MRDGDNNLKPPGEKHVSDVERAAYVVAALLVLSGLFHLAVLIVGGGTWEGPISFRKPATFGLSFGAVLFAVIWQLSFLKLTQRMHILAVSVFAIACALQTALICLQAWRGVPSHFNLATPLDAAIARVLAFGGFVLVACAVSFTIISFRRRVLIVVRAGLLSLLVSQVIGATMIARGVRLALAGNLQAAHASSGWHSLVHVITLLPVLLPPALTWTQRRECTAHPNL